MQQLTTLLLWMCACGAAAGHTKAAHCCAWNSMLKVVASGSADRRVLLYNPFSCRTLGALEGHTAPVVCLGSNERDMQIISASADNTIKVGTDTVAAAAAAAAVAAAAMSHGQYILAAS